MENSLLLIVIILVITSVILLFKQLFVSFTNSTKLQSLSAYKYEKRQCISTTAETKFYKTLQEITKDIFYIFPQVHLSTLVNHEIPGQNWKGALSHIQRKSVDYVFCDKETMETILVLELDDASHNEEERVLRDLEVERILKEASILILRIPYSKSDDREFLRNELRKYLL